MTAAPRSNSSDDGTSRSIEKLVRLDSNDYGRSRNSKRVRLRHPVRRDTTDDDFVDPEKYYGFSQFAIQLNEVTQLERDFLPTSDSRLRPDQIALEMGNIDEAEATKIRVEEKQREKRKIENEQGGHVAEHFVPNGDGWTFAGDYCTSSSINVSVPH